MYYRMLLWPLWLGRSRAGSDVPESGSSGQGQMPPRQCTICLTILALATFTMLLQVCCSVLA